MDHSALCSNRQQSTLPAQLTHLSHSPSYSLKLTSTVFTLIFPSRDTKPTQTSTTTVMKSVLLALAAAAVPAVRAGVYPIAESMAGDNFL